MYTYHQKVAAQSVNYQEFQPQPACPQPLPLPQT
jgi:hypothetical protein